MFVNTIDPVLFSLGPLQVRYYGLMYVIGFVLAYFFLVKLSKERELPFSKDDIEEFLLWAIVGVIVGSRIVYVLAYNLSYYIQNPLQVFAIWQGGLSFHGGLIGIILVALWFCRKHKVSFYKLADIVVIPAALGLALGRIGNFLNSELVGRVTSLPWGVEFNQEGVYRHPSQLYESLKNFFMFGVLWNIRNKKFRDGFLFWMFIMMYGVLRFVIEFFRAPDPQVGFVLGPLTMGQLLVLPMFIIGLIMVLKLRRPIQS